MNGIGENECEREPIRLDLVGEECIAKTRQFPARRERKRSWKAIFYPKLGLIRSDEFGVNLVEISARKLQANKLFFMYFVVNSVRKVKSKIS